MFSFFKRSKSQKGKQKHDKLQLPADDGASAGEGLRTEPHAKVASDAYASANVPQTGCVQDDGHRAPRSHAGDEETVAKNIPHRPQSPPAPIPPASSSGPLATPAEPVGQRQLLPSKWPPSTSDGVENPSRVPFGVSSSDPTYGNGSARNGESRENESCLEADPGYGSNREASSSPIDDSGTGCAREPQTYATSPNPYAPPSESAMAKGKNRRRYQQPQQQQQQQHQQHHQQQHVKGPNGLKLAAGQGRRSDSSERPEGPLSHLAKAMSMVAADPIKVIQEAVRVNGDVTAGGGEHRPNAEPIAPTADRPPSARTRTDGGENSPEDACAPTHLTVVTNTTTNSPPPPQGATRVEELLNMKNVPSHEHHRQQAPGPAADGATVLVPAGEDHSRAPLEVANASSSTPIANPDISQADAARSREEPPNVAQDSSAPEMGQQPSRSEPVKSKSCSPQPFRTVAPPLAPSPPPRNQRSATAVAAGQDAPGDDTSDDRDVFYEAKESLSPVPAGTDGGTPEPIRASLVLKPADPAGGRKKQVSFKLTQNGSDDVEVTSADSDDSDVDSDTHSANQTAFSDDNCNPPPYGRTNYIEFQYDHSAPEAKTAEKEDGKCEKPHGDGSSPGVLIEDSVTTSLPDVVQPSNSEPLLPPTSFGTVEKINSEMKDLVNQESRYSAKFEEAEKRVKEANVKVYELQQKLDAVERDALLKEYNVERLQAELVAALKECDGIRARLTTQQTEMETIRLKASEREDELNLKYQNLEIEHLELTEKLTEVRKLAHDLNSQLIDAKSEVDRLKEERQKLLDERTEGQKIMREALEESVRERTQLEAKWKHSFEQLRDVNNAREEDLMKDCEFTIRSMQKSCKEKMETVEKERKQALEQVSRLEDLARKRTDEMRHLKSYEAEVEQLRGLTYDQKEALASMTRQVEGLKAELETAYNKLEEEMVKVQQIKNRCEYQLCEKEREALNRIEIARGEIAMQWEDRLLHEMNRLKVELEQTHMEERTSAIEKIRRETMAETEALSKRFNECEKQLKQEIESLKAKLGQQKSTMANAQTEADQKLLQSRMYVERAEREHERKLAKEMAEKDEIIENLKAQFEQEKKALELHFSERIQQVQEEFAREISDSTELMRAAHKKEMEGQWKTLVAEKEKALQLMDNRNRNRLEDAENKIRELSTGHQRQLKDLQEEHSFVVHSLESRDSKNAQEIQTLHKKCRCLTNLFEEMRLRYERREPRPEDMQQIEELKNVIELQERDLRQLTERLREVQLQQMQRDQQPPQTPRRSKPNRGRQQKPQQNQQQQSNRQQQESNRQQPKKMRQQQPPAEPEEDDQLPFEEVHQEEDEIQFIPPPPPGVAMPVPQMVPPMGLRTQCDVIYEENEADILREEEEEAHMAEGLFQQRIGDSNPIAAETNENGEELSEAEDKDEMVMVVDVPESAIQTEDRMIHSTTPTIIDEMETENTQGTVTEGLDEHSPELHTSVVVIPIESITEPTVRPRASSTPRIIITDDAEKEDNESTVVEITEEPLPTVVELPAVFAKPYPAPADIVTECVGDSPRAVASEPQKTLPHMSMPEGAES